MPVFYLTGEISFPPPRLATKEGLLAVGGDLSQERLISAYRNGIFPWFSHGESILWWSPDPRLVLYPEELRVSKSLKKIIKKDIFHVTLDEAFDEVIKECAGIRLRNNEGTWIVEDMIEAYCRLHRFGFAHSAEAWYNKKLVGGIYGVSLGKCFFGESMFTRMSNASKVAFVRFVNYLKELSFDMIDCQLTTNHLLNFGAHEIPRALFLKQLEKSLEAPTIKGKWSFY